MAWDGIDAALTAGFDTIEHGDGFTEDLMDRAVKQGAFWCPTMFVGEWVAKPRGGIWLQLPELEAKAVRKALVKGVKIVGAGTLNDLVLEAAGTLWF
jgi:hypothetical protein